MRERVRKVSVFLTSIKKQYQLTDILGHFEFRCIGVWVVSLTQQYTPESMLNARLLQQLLYRLYSKVKPFSYSAMKEP